MSGEPSGKDPSDHVRSLGEVSRTDAPSVGTKAAYLGELSRAGFPVPDGFVLTTSAFDRFLAANDLGGTSRGDGDTASAVATAPLPAEVSEALERIAGAFGDAPLAVRSSGVAEDLAGASYAGQYETVLDVKGRESLEAAVRRCWASAFAERVRVYRAGADQDRQAARAGMAVIVQRLVRADAAGVAFSANPVTGDRDEAVVGAVRGLGDRLVSGKASPDEWLVRGGQAIPRSTPEGAVDASQVQQVAELARRVAVTLGSPQDVEWALADGEVYLLQARPITSLPEQAPSIPEPVIPPGYWEKLDNLYLRPLMPVDRLLPPMLTAAEQRAFAEIGLLAETTELREIGGWVYSSQVPIGGRKGPTPGIGLLPPPWLLRLLIRVVPEFRKRVRRSAEWVRANRGEQIVERWYGEWMPSLASRIDDLLEVDLAALSDEDLGRHVSRTIDLLGDAFDIHFGVHSGLGFALARLAFACRDLLGWDDRQTLELLAGLSTASTDPSHRLSDLARMASERPRVRQILEAVSEDTPARLAEVDPELAAAFARYLREHGSATLARVFSAPTLAERPTLVLALIRDWMSSSYDPGAEEAAQSARRSTARASASAMLSARPAAERERFERALRLAERAYPIREDLIQFTGLVPAGVVRYALLEVGRRLAEREVIPLPEDVCFLEIAEAREALRDGLDRRALVRRRQLEFAWYEAHPGPASYGKVPGPLPSLDALPPESRLVHEIVIWYSKLSLGERPDGPRQVGTSTLRGLAASPGRYTGPVRVVLDEGQFGKLKPGDVLVCPMTNPTWSVLFPSIGALVTDTGGILSHPAIIAREYRVPGVVAVGNATKVLRDGQMVTVDGDAGTVGVLG